MSDTSYELRSDTLPDPAPYDELDAEVRPPRLWETREEHIALCSQGKIPDISHTNKGGDTAIRSLWCNSVMCPICNAFWSNRIKERTDEYLTSQELDGVWRVVVEVEGDYDKFRDRLNRHINKAGARKNFYPTDTHITVHMDRRIDLTSYGQSPVFVSTSDIDWSKEIITTRRKSGNMKIKREKEEGLIVHATQFTTRRKDESGKSEREIVAEAWAEAILRTSIPLPAYSPDMSEQHKGLIQAMYNERDAIFRQEMERLGGEIIGTRTVRVNYLSWENSIGRQLVKTNLPRFVQKQQLMDYILGKMPGKGRDRE